MPSFEDSYNFLNDEQRQAVDTIDGPVLVVAGPGSGKTQLLSMRVANILRERDVEPRNILCLTFTESGAVNMKQRLASMIGNDAYQVQINTFHSFCTGIIGQYPEYFYNGEHFTAADDLAQVDILEGIFEAMRHDNPLRTKGFSGEFLYLKDARSAIGNIKKAGLTADELEQILESNEKVYVEVANMIAAAFAERMSKKRIGVIATLVDQLAALPETPLPIKHATFKPYLSVLVSSLGSAVTLAQELDSTKPISEWKKKWLKKDENKRDVLRASVDLAKLKALLDVYRGYKQQMSERGLFDFDDMILDTIGAIETNDALRFDLQEQFQYILVDEFQDTNDAQTRLLHAITGVYEGAERPNIMVVGDDDQAIYKFQGAEISNILEFSDVYKDPSVIVLTKNYRSTQHILDIARHVVLQGEERLENSMPGLVKELVASNPKITEAGGEIDSHTYLTAAHQYYGIASDIAEQIADGKNACDIAIIARNHRELQAMVPYLRDAGVPIAYERQQKVLDQPHIYQLITMASYVTSLMNKDRDAADELLPEMLSYPFWNLSRKDIWQIAATARKDGYRLWLDVMLESEHEQLQQIANFFLSLASKAKYTPMDVLMDMLMGTTASKRIIRDDSEDESNPPESDPSVGGEEVIRFTSSFREYYFGEQAKEEDMSQYVAFLSSLRKLTSALQDYKAGERVLLEDMLEFVDAIERYQIPFMDTSPFVSASDAVQLITAHKSKGLEFDTVYVLSCQQDVWVPRNKGNKINFPENLPLSPAGENLDDHMRLFFVALTRAKQHLYMTDYLEKESGKEALRLSFISAAADHEYHEHVKQVLEVTKREVGDKALKVSNILAAAWDGYHHPPIVEDEKPLLLELVKNYQLPVSHLNTFLDVSRGGPSAVLTNSILRFPQAKNVATAYGSAMHKTIELMYTTFRKDEKLPSLDDVLETYALTLKKYRLSEEEYELYKEKGSDALTIYYQDNVQNFGVMDKIEVDFKREGVVIGNAPLAGKIDKLVPSSDDTLVVHDFKTGKAKDSWIGKTPMNKISLLHYKRQLAYYKLLVEYSGTFTGKTVNTGVIEYLEPLYGKAVQLSHTITEEEVERLKKLIVIVYNKIKTLDFPDVSEYSPDIKGIEQFEEDLLAGKV